MSKKVKDIGKQNRTYYIFNDVINIKKFNPDKIEIAEVSYKNIFI